MAKRLSHILNSKPEIQATELTEYTEKLKKFDMLSAYPDRGIHFTSTGCFSSVISVAKFFFRLNKFWKIIRELSGDDGYERYLAHLTSAHPDKQPLSRRAWFAYQQQQKWSGIKRCC